MTAAEGPPTPEEIDRFMRATVTGEEMTGCTLEMLEDRIIALEEIAAAAWPRWVFLARRLRRAIRARIKGRPGRDFADRRVSAISYELAEREGRWRSRRAGETGARPPEVSP